jgi:hypothetical protein
MPTQVAGRVIVDPHGARKFMVQEAPNYTDAGEPEEKSQIEDSNQGDGEQTRALPRIKPRSRRPSEEEQFRNRDFFLANPQHFITMNPIIETYCLSTNEWSKLLALKICPVAVLMAAVKCDLDYFEPIKWNAAAFDHLVLDQDYKDILKTFSHTHNEASGKDDGLIAGKGETSSSARDVC